MGRFHVGLVAGCALLIYTAAANRADAQPNAQPSGTNPKALAARLGLTGQGAGKWLQRLTETADGRTSERLIVVNTDGEPLGVESGATSAVELTEETLALLRRPGRSVVLVHNHPGSTGLSALDIGHVDKPGVAAVVALGHDGSVFVASAGPGMRSDTTAWRQYGIAEAEVARQLQRWLRPGGIPIVAADLHRSHLVMQALARAAVIEYWFALRGRSLVSYRDTNVAFAQVVAVATARLGRHDARR